VGVGQLDDVQFGLRAAIKGCGLEPQVPVPALHARANTRAIIALFFLPRIRSDCYSLSPAYYGDEQQASAQTHGANTSDVQWYEELG
jgi:hypothetical protein